MEKNVKRGFCLVLTLLIILFNIMSVFAYSHYGGFFTDFSGGVGGFVEQIGSYIGQILAPILGPSETGEFLFAKILLFFLLFAIIFMVIGRINILGDNRAIQSIVAIIVSIFAVRYIQPGEFINAILLPYGALGISISIFLPLLIFFFFLHANEIGGFGRRAAWIIYLIAFLLLWGSREYDSLGIANWLYVLGLGFVIISLIFDRSIHRYFLNAQVGEAGEEIRERAVAEWIEQLELAERHGNENRAKKIRNILRRRYNIRV